MRPIGAQRKCRASEETPRGRGEGLNRKVEALQRSGWGMSDLDDEPFMVSRRGG